MASVYISVYQLNIYRFCIVNPQARDFLLLTIISSSSLGIFKNVRLLQKMSVRCVRQVNRRSGGHEHVTIKSIFAKYSDGQTATAKSHMVLRFGIASKKVVRKIIFQKIQYQEITLQIKLCAGQSANFDGKGGREYCQNNYANSQQIQTSVRSSFTGMSFSIMCLVYTHYQQLIDKCALNYLLPLILCGARELIMSSSGSVHNQ